jgi:hypothetical protein
MPPVSAQSAGYPKNAEWMPGGHLMLCPNCRREIPDQSTFCAYCGWLIPHAPSSRMSNPPKRRISFAEGFIVGLIVLVVLLAAVRFLIGSGLLTLGSSTLSASQTPAVTTGLPTTALPLASPTPAPTLTPPVTSTSRPAQTGNLPLGITPDELLDYFADIALKSEFGDTGANGIVCRWEKPIKVEILGDYSSADYDWLTAHIANLNQIDGMPAISIVAADGNYRVWFKTLDRLREVIPGYVSENWGFISLYWNSKKQITDAFMGIATDVTNQTQRNHLILEEFTQGLGLLNDSPQYADSIFQIEWTETQALADVDYALIRMLYSSAVQAGMKEADARTNLAAWLAKE